jgi:hypothetical protein
MNMYVDPKKIIISTNEDESIQPNNELSKAEKEIVDRYIFLPVIRMALERDKKIIMQPNTKFKQQYVNIIDEAIHHVTMDMRKNKDDIFNYHIRMTKKDWFNYDCYVRGQLINVTYHKSIAADLIYNQIDEYLK